MMNAPSSSDSSTRRLALLSLCLLLPVPSLGVLCGMVWLPESGVGQVIFAISKLWILALPLFWHVVIERKPCSGSPPRHGGFLTAIATGLPIAIVIALGYLLVRHLGWIDVEMVRERASLTGLAKPTLFIGAAIYWITINSLLEEYVWRWFVFQQFEKLIGSRAAVVASALGFTLHHVFAVGAQFDWKINVVASCGVFTGGIIWSWMYLRYRSVWPCWLSHAFADVPIFVAGWFLIFG